MRKILPDVLEQGRVTEAHDKTYGTKTGDPFGAFNILSPHENESWKLRIIANNACSQSHGWEHVSISLSYRTPTWEEMSFVKDLFWNDDECVVQFHPPHNEYVNHHPYTLHLWRHEKVRIKLPPASLIGP